MRSLIAGVALAACAAALIAASPAPAAVDDGTGTSIVYSDSYKQLVAAFPSGYADECDIDAVLNGGGGVCDHRVDVVYFYPDGTLGARRWYVDASSSTGWSIERDPCDGLAGEDYELWAAYVDHVNGYLESGPDLTADRSTGTAPAGAGGSDDAPFPPITSPHFGSHGLSHDETGARDDRHCGADSEHRPGFRVDGNEAGRR